MMYDTEDPLGDPNDLSPGNHAARKNLPLTAMILKSQVRQYDAQTLGFYCTALSV